MNDATMAAPAVYQSIAVVASEINALGIAKDGRAKGGGIEFPFRGIDGVLNTFSGPMSRNGLLMIPSYDEICIDERPTANSKTYHARVRGSYLIVCTKDGSSLSLGFFYGEANDTQDKAIAKAQSIALRQAYLQTFCVPLGPEYDPEATDHGDNKPAAEASNPKPAKKVEGEVMPKAGNTGTGEPLKENQRRILKANIERKGGTIEDVEKHFGALTAANLNDAMSWIKTYGNA